MERIVFIPTLARAPLSRSLGWRINYTQNEMENQAGIVRQPPALRFAEHFLRDLVVPDFG